MRFLREMQLFLRELPFSANTAAHPPPGGDFGVFIERIHFFAARRLALEAVFIYKAIQNLGAAVSLAEYSSFVPFT